MNDYAAQLGDAFPDVEDPPRFQPPRWVETSDDDDDPFADPAPTVGGHDNSPGPWFVAGFDGECARGCAGIEEGEEARAVGDGSGEYECRACVETNRDAEADGPGFGYWSEGDL